LFAALLPDRQRVLGPDHPDTLSTRSNLAASTGEAGDGAGAQDLFAGQLVIRPPNSEPIHSATVASTVAVGPQPTRARRAIALAHPSVYLCT
jgi:hypothetical protein